MRDYAIFRNKGYIGLYNLSLNQILHRKGLDADVTLHDYMGKEELAANWFRVTQTEAKLRRAHPWSGSCREDRIQCRSGSAARYREDGRNGAEDLPPAENIKKVKSGLKKRARELQRMDKKKRLPAPKNDG